MPPGPALIHSDEPRMPKTLVKYVLCVATMIAAWLVVSPARAEAPLCDQRGATTFAPAPQLQQIQLSIDIGTSDECDPLALLRVVSPDRPVVWDAPSPEPMALGAAPPRFVPGAQPVCFADTRLLDPALGVRSSVDRPPRA